MQFALYIYIYFFPIPSLCNSFLSIHNYMLLSTSSVIIWRRSSTSSSFWEDHQPQTKQLETMCFWEGILTIYWVLKKDEIGINVTQQRSSGPIKGSQLTPHVQVRLTCLSSNIHVFLFQANFMSAKCCLWIHFFVLWFACFFTMYALSPLYFPALKML